MSIWLNSFFYIGVYSQGKDLNNLHRFIDSILIWLRETFWEKQISKEWGGVHNIFCLLFGTCSQSADKYWTFLLVHDIYTNKAWLTLAMKRIINILSHFLGYFSIIFMVVSFPLQYTETNCIKLFSRLQCLPRLRSKILALSALQLLPWKIGG